MLGECPSLTKIGIPKPNLFGRLCFEQPARGRCGFGFPNTRCLYQPGRRADIFGSANARYKHPSREWTGPRINGNVWRQRLGGDL